MKAETLAIPDLILVTPPRFGDDRGFFSETYHQSRYEEAGITLPFVQDNHSLSRSHGVIRGLHCQLDPFAQGKLVRVIRGSIWDVAVDIRTSSPTYGQHAGVILSADNWQQLWVPPGFLHGFCTLEPDTEVQYKVTALYNKSAERAIAWDDPQLALPWPVPKDEIIVSDKDANLPGIDAAKGWFA